MNSTCTVCNGDGFQTLLKTTHLSTVYCVCLPLFPHTYPVSICATYVSLLTSYHTQCPQTPNSFPHITLNVPKHLTLLLIPHTLSPNSSYLPHSQSPQTPHTLSSYHTHTLPKHLLWHLPLTVMYDHCQYLIPCSYGTGTCGWEQISWGREGKWMDWQSYHVLLHFMMACMQSCLHLLLQGS